MRVPTFRSGALWRSLAAVLSLGLAALLVVGSAGPAAAASSAEFLGMGPSRTVNGKIGSQNKRADAGIMRMTIDGVEARGFCIDIETKIYPGTAGLEEQGWDESNVANLADVEKILANYHPQGDGPAGYALVGDANDKAAGTQAAIWHYTDGFNLNQNTSGSRSNGQNVIDNYNAIIKAIDDDVLSGFGEPTASLDIDSPASTEGLAGDLVGPFTVISTSDAITLTPASGTTLHNADGSELSGPVESGTEVYMKRTEAGAGSFEASAEATVQAGRVFYKSGVQRLILADQVTVPAKASASASWTDAGTATVRKETIGRPGEFSFSLTGPGLPEGGVSTSIDGSGEAAFDAKLTPGSEYTMTEADADGYLQTPLSCTVDHRIDGSAISFTAPEAAPRGSEGIAVICDFENTATYDLTVTKNVVADEGLWAEAGFDPETDLFGVDATCTSEGADHLVFDAVEVAHGGSVTFGPVPHGYACTVSEDVTGAELADGFSWVNPEITPESEIIDGDGDEIVVNNDITGETTTTTTDTTAPDTTDTTAPDTTDKPRGGLPITGANSLIILAVGAALVVGGGALVIGTRKRRGA